MSRDRPELGAGGEGDRAGPLLESQPDAQTEGDAPGGDDWGEPLVRALAQAALVQTNVWLQGAGEPHGAGATLAAHGVVAPLGALEKLLKRVSWGGDRTRGVARLEFGSGVLAGGTLLIEAVHGRVSLTLELPRGATDPAWVDKLGARLRARGLRIDELRVQ